ncbi:hypothetical protein, partial [Chryseobacterium sp.]|uniref:hypothetical protein n=1 Tax=Chryseobacterium sp. TaxID=1871047 RepID=UPI00283AC1C6
IPEIIITPPSTNPPIHDPIPNTGGDGTYTPPYTGDMSGGPIMHGGGTGTSTTQDPCKKIKEKQSNLKYAAKFDSLNKKKIFDMDKERGYYELQPPKGIGAESGFVQVDGPSGSTGLDLPDNTDRISGLFHSHNNVNGSVKIFSPTDVKTFINTFLKNAREYAGSYSDAYSTVITSEGSYTLKYTKSTHPGGINYDTSKIWKEWYEGKMDKIIDEDGNLPQNKVEEVFTQFLNEVVNIDGLEIYKVTANSAIRITYNPNTKQVNSVPCP